LNVDVISIDQVLMLLSLVVVVAKVLFVAMELHEDEEDVTLLLGVAVFCCIGVVVV